MVDLVEFKMTFIRTILTQDQEVITALSITVTDLNSNIPVVLISLPN